MIEKNFANSSLVSSVAYTNNIDAFRFILSNLCRQSLFKEGNLELIFLVENISREEIDSYLKWIEPNNFLVYNISQPVNILFQKVMNEAKGKYLSIISDDISLRPDALSLLSEYFEFNSEYDLVYSEEILCSDRNLIFENCSSRIALRFVNPFLDVVIENSTFPKIFLAKKELLWNFDFGSFDELFNQFWNGVLKNQIRIDKFDAILGVRLIDISFSPTDDINELDQKIFQEIVTKIFGRKNVQLISNAELGNLPYHFNNIFNDLVSVILLNPEDSSEEDLHKTMTSLNYINHPNIEILKHRGKISQLDEVRVKNLLFNISAGKFVITILAGDEIFPNFITNALKMVSNLTDKYFIYSDFYHGESKSLVQALDYSFDKLQKFNYVPCSVFLPRKFLVNFGYFDEKFHSRYASWEFFIRIGKNGIQGYRIAQPLFNIKRNFETIPFSFEDDATLKAQIIEKHKELFTDIQIFWSKKTILGKSSFDNSMIPIGIIPNNELLTKIKKNKGEEMFQSKRILFVMYGWNESGGGTIFPRSIALELAKRGWEVSVFYASTDYVHTHPTYSLKVHSESNVKLFGLYNRPAPFVELENTEREIYDPKVVEVFRRVLDETQPTLVHFHNLHGLTLALPKVAKEYGLPTLFTPHNYYMIDPNLYMYNSDLSLWRNTDFFENSELYRHNPSKKTIYERRQEFTRELLSQWFDLTLAVSRRQKEILLDFAPFASNIIVVHQIAPNVDELWNSENLKALANRPVPRRIRVGYIGWILPHKGVHILAKSAQNFLPIDIEFKIYGQATFKYLEQLQEIDRKKMLQFFGEYRPDELERIAGEVDIAVVTSVTEDCAPLTLAELSAMRLPIIASKIGGIPDFVVDGVNGFLYDYDSVDSLTSAIRFCSFNPETIEEMRRHLSPYHTFSDYLIHIERIYSEMIGGKRSDFESLELIVTPRISQKKKIADIHFISHIETPETLSDFVNSFGFDLIDIKQIDETQSFYTYRIDLKVPKPITLEEFLNATENAHLPTQGINQEKLEESATFDLEELSALIDRTEAKFKDGMKITEFVNSEETLKPQTVEETKVTEPIEPELNVVWEGSQFVFHSLALINREHCHNLIQSGVVEVTIIPYEAEQFLPNSNPKYETLSSKDIRYKETPPEHIRKLPYLWVRHQWPPKAEPPKGAKWVIIQPWEFSSLPRKFVDIFLQADELWVPSNYTRRAFINSGIPFNKVQIVPNGIDPDLFQPSGELFPLKTNKKLKFLYVGGTIYRKGIDILLQSYVSNFTSKDDVTLVIKDMGTESFYFGQTAQDRISSIQNTEGTPEIIYIKDQLTEKEMASLYRACDVFVSPYRGEGFSLPTLEAMASGLPVIVTEGGATEDFVLDSFGWKIPSYQISVGEYIGEDPLVGEAFLLEPDPNYLGKLMRSIYQNPSDITVRGILASQYARQYWTWKKSTLKVLSRIDALYGKNLAIKAMNKLIDKIDSQILLGRAEQYFANGEIAEAKKILTNVLLSINELCTRHKVFLLTRLAIIELLEDNIENSKSYLKQLDEIFPDHIDRIYLEAKIELKKGDLISALEKYTDLVSRWNQNRFDNVTSYSLDTLLTEMGEIFIQMGDMDNALQLFIESLKLNENNYVARLGSARCFISIKDFEEARRMIQWVLDRDPQNSEAIELMSSFSEVIPKF
ncbi:MAG: glycosyltransferase [Candidatus Kapaibacteriales bacterium]